MKGRDVQVDGCTYKVSQKIHKGENAKIYLCTGPLKNARMVLKLSEGEKLLDEIITMTVT